MRVLLTILPVLLPIILGALIPTFNFTDKKKRECYVLGVVLVNTALIFLLFAMGIRGRVEVLHLTGSIDLAFRIDGLGMAFGGLLAALWPLASLYAFEYMEHEGRENTFFTWYTITYGVAVGIAFASNLITMYLCYEILTLVTLPIIMHEMDVKAISAGRKYLMYSMCGAAFGLMAIMVLMTLAGTTEFAYGGVLIGAEIDGKQMILQWAYLIAFFGFGVKAAVWPLHGWLPSAGVAPTPVTALLHAVAVVNAGVFAIMRVTYYAFGTDVVKGTWVQYTVQAFVFFTIVFGSSMALKEQHLKRRLAYSTVANLSYMLLGVTMMSPEGFQAGIAHMVFHGTMKIVLFFAAGAVIVHAHREYVFQMRGIGYKMPVVFVCFTVGSLGVIGVPGICGFISKYYLAESAVKSGSPFAYIGVAALIISAVLTAIYTMTVVVTVFCPENDYDKASKEGVEDAGWQMKLPMVVLSIAMILMGLFSGPLITFFTNVAGGLV